MHTFIFDRFKFDANALELCDAHGQPVELRPKTAELLRVLVTDRSRVVSKRELVTRIWHTEHVTDQSVFQAMSELRRQLAPLKPIKTFPNRGYQWVLPTVEQDSTPTVSIATSLRAWRTAVAASLAIVGLTVAIGASFSTSRVPKQAPVAVTLASPSLPALVAFSEGAAALQRGDVEYAVELLELSVTERPEFVEARLLLAEAYLLNGQAQEARHRVDSVMNELTPATNAYSLIAAMDLLSRTDRELGSMSSALEWAARAADQANSSGYECTAADLHDRVLAMASDPELATDSLRTSPVFASDFARRMLNAALAQREQAESALAEDFGLAKLSTPKSSDSKVSGAGAVRNSAFDRTAPATAPFGVSGRPEGALSPLVEPAAGKRPAHCDRFPGSSSEVQASTTDFEQA